MTTTFSTTSLEVIGEIVVIRATLYALVVCLTLFPSRGFAEESQQEVIAFVGRLISIKELSNQCPKSEAAKEISPGLSICIQPDSLYEATYEVLDTLSGSAASREISFHIADHYGFPGFAHYTNALLFVSVNSDGNWLEKYQGYPVHRTTSGFWASCGNPYDDRVNDTPRHLQKLSFVNDLGIVGEFSSDGLAKRFFDERYISISDGRVRCHTGVVASDLYEMVRVGVMSARGIQIPELGAREHDL